MLNTSQVISIPLLVSLYIPYRRAMNDRNQAARLEDQPSPLRSLGSLRLTRVLFRQLDIVGLLGLIAIFGFILVPFTVTGGAHNARGASLQWSRPVIIVPLIIGFLCIPGWIWWERKAARHPLVPFRVRSPLKSFQLHLLNSVPASERSCCMGRSWYCLHAHILLGCPGRFPLHGPHCCVW